MRALGTTVGVALFVGAFYGSAWAGAASGDQLLQTHCATCHERQVDGGYSRISRIRQTPEGWDMSIHRMVTRYGIQLSPANRHNIVKFLADTRGLAPQEAKPFRYVIERRPNSVETHPDAEVARTCAVCHSYARAALQGRDATEWLHVIHQHVGQFFTVEYQNGMRQRNWWDEVTSDMPKRLARLYALESEAWSAWQKHPRANLEGTWRVVGHRRGLGQYAGEMWITRLSEDEYGVRYTLQYAQGDAVAGTGTAIVYTGYEWRGSTRLGEDSISEVFTVSDDGNSLSGRWFFEKSDEVGAELRAVRTRPGYAEILTVEPSYLRAGMQRPVQIHGVGLDGAIALGAGVEVVEIQSRSPETIRAIVKVAADAVDGPRTVGVGSATGDGLLAIFHRVGSVRVEPAEAMARVGGGAIPPVTAQFEAVAFGDGPDGKSGTGDDFRIGSMSAKWVVDNFDEVAKARQDANFAGTMESTGLFMPGLAGPNPARPRRTNNWGNLTVQATVDDNDRPVIGTGHLIVTIQRWVDTPIN